MKAFVSIVAFLFAAISAGAQTFMKTTSEYNGQKYPSYIMEYNLPPSETEDVIKNELKRQGFNAVKSKGYLMYRNVRLETLNGGIPQDVFFKIERKSRKESDKTLVTLISAKPGEIPAGKVKGAKTVADISTSTGSEYFLNSFKNAVETASHDMAVKKQTDEVAKAEKKLEQLQKDQLKLEKKLKDLESEIQTNLKDQEKQNSEILRQKDLLEQVKKQAL